MHSLIETGRESNEIRGYLWDESKRKSDFTLMRVSDIVVGGVGSVFLLVFFTHPYAWILGLSGLFFLVYIVIYRYRSPDINATFSMSELGVVTFSRQKKYNKNFTWDEIVDITEIVVVQSAANFCHHSDYILLMKKPHAELNVLIATDKEYAMERYGYLYRHPDIIAIPKTEETVRYIEQIKTD